MEQPPKKKELHFKSSIRVFKLSKKQEITRERFIVFLDIMGFKDRVARTDHDSLLFQLEKLNSEISKHINNNKEHGIKLSQFSDSILIYSSNSSAESLESISKVTCNVMQTAIKAGFPLKGAIAKGKITCDTTKQLYFGQALIDAYLLEENVKYYGVLAHNSVEADIKKIKNRILFHDIEVPLKSGIVCHYELAWHIADRDASKSDLAKIRETVSSDPRKYIDNTIKVIDSYKVP